MRLGRYGRNPGWLALAVLAVIYGLGVAFIPEGPSQLRWITIGSIVVGVVFVVVMVIPFVLWLVRRDSAGPASPTAP